MKCKYCKESIVIFVDINGAIYILDRPKYGYIGLHNCGAKYNEMLSSSLMKKLGITASMEAEG